MFTTAAIVGGIAGALYLGFKIYQNWPRVNSVSDLQDIFKNYNSVDDLKVAFEDAKAKVDIFKTNLEAEIKSAEDKVTALKTLLD